MYSKICSELLITVIQSCKDHRQYFLTLVTEFRESLRVKLESAGALS